ncbi:MAG: hypothetical protein H0T73_06835 [Ardenticatenales bacterium]|nr:hypothetical protein [Ardenticatenales bacterium]
MAILLGRLLAHIEVLEAEIVVLRAENQALRDEINRLKGQKGGPEFKANQPPRASEDPVTKPRAERTPPQPQKPRRARIEIDRTETVGLNRAELPGDFQPLGYREVVVG